MIEMVDASVWLPLVGAFVVGALALGVIYLREERQRVQSLQDWAAKNGWRYTKGGPLAWRSRLPSGTIIGATLTGTVDGRPVTIAEFRYSSGAKDSATNHAVAVLVLIDGRHPPVDVDRRGMFSKLGRSLLGDRPTATGNEAFDAEFRISAADPNYARLLVGPPLMAAHLDGSVPWWSVDGNGLLTWHHGRVKDPGTVPTVAAPLIRVAELLGRREA
ncbi:hypothetical protein [Nocardia sp. NPDC052566]|uniref:hypothetical protein n=1 Tax=Nocardia sp. NPDC052566 TaxID=3364330 RepID=UPI0037C80E60